MHDLFTRTQKSFNHNTIFVEYSVLIGQFSNCAQRFYDQKTLYLNKYNILKPPLSIPKCFYKIKKNMKKTVEIVLSVICYTFL